DKPGSVIGLAIGLTAPRFVHTTWLAPELSVVVPPAAELHAGAAPPVVPVPDTDVTLSKLPLESRMVVPTAPAVAEGEGVVVGSIRFPDVSNVSVPVLFTGVPLASP